MGAAGAEVAAAVADAHRREWSFVLAATARVATDLDAAEEAVQEAYASALTTWEERGIPRSPGAWLTTAARRRALDQRRRAAVAQRALPALLPEPDGEDEAPAVPDDRLRLVFTCCHPALSEEAQVALTLRLVCGLSTAEVARAFLVSEPTMAARITRAKKKIATARIPYRVPEAEDLPERLQPVLWVVHLVYTTGHTAPEGDDLMRRGLAERGMELALLLRQLLPREPEVAGLLALILLTDARRSARVDVEGTPVLLPDQDRSAWDRASIAAGLKALTAAFELGRPGRFTLMAAIAAVHDEATTWADTDWQQIRGLYDVLQDLWPSPIVALNRAVAVAFADGPDAGLAELDRLAAEPALAGYRYFAAARAELLARVGRIPEARDAVEEALLLTGNAAERRLLERKLAALPTAERAGPHRSPLRHAAGMDWSRLARDVNTLAAFCGRRDVPALSRAAVEAAAGGPVDAVILFGGSIVAGAAVLAEAIRARVALTSMIVGGQGHTTEALRAMVAERTGWPDVGRLSEAALFARFLQERFALPVDLLEEESTNCGNNVANALAVLRAAGVPARRLLILQDATMQLRMDAGFRRQAPDVRLVNHATYRAVVVPDFDGLRYESPPDGMWPVDRYVAMLLGEIPRLRDDASGYGPSGAGFLAHVDVPDGVLAAHERLLATGRFHARAAITG